MADPTAIYHWHRLDDRVTTSGQPTEEQLVEIAALGVRRVINLGLHSLEKALPNEAASVTALGMVYTHIPVEFQNPTEADFATFSDALVAEQGKLHIHCIANYRVSAFVYRYRRSVLGVDAAQARIDLDQVWQPDAVWAAFIGL